MGLYSLDRFNGFGLTMMTKEPIIVAQQAPETQSIAYTKGAYLERRAEMTSGPLLSYLITQAAAPAPAKTDQQKAEEELAALEKAAHEAETAAVVEETLDIGEPEKTPWLLYGGIGAGALLLIGGVIFATKKKGAKKVAGYRKRRRR